ncbi:MAG: hypothetical protein ACYCZX_19645 [Rhodospirillaceae bacterium]
MLTTDRQGRSRSRLPWFSGLALVGWQVVAGLLVLTGQADVLLASWPDPAWFVMIAAAILSPPHWLAAVAVLAGAGLMIWSFIRQPLG